jgi:two-component system, sensor histidine kinase and response regulator
MNSTAAAITTVAKAPVILVAEDESKLRFIICELLSAEGYEVLEASDGEEARELFILHRPEMVVSDIRMPRLDGYGLLAAVRRLAAWYETPFVFLSARADQTDIRAGMLAGADDYMLKPFEPDELLKVVADRLQRVREVRGQMREAQLQLIRRLPHELRTPLNGISGLTDLLRLRSRDDHPPASSELEEIGRMLKVSADRMQRMVEDVLFWSEITVLRGDTSAFEDRFNDGSEWVAALGHGCEQIAAGHGRSSDLRMEVECAASAVPGRRLLQVVSHLVDNACKFSPPGTRIEVNLRLSGGRFLVRVVDAGRGMTREEIGQIGAFRQFRREKFEQQGLGLGLAIASAYAARHGGILVVTPGISGTGLVAEITLPLDRLNPKCRQCADEGAPPGGQDCTRHRRLSVAPMAAA